MPNLKPLLDKNVRALWLAEAAEGRPPPARMVAELQYDLAVNWHHEEAFLGDRVRIDPDSSVKRLVCVEAGRGSGKSMMAAFRRLYMAEFIIPFLNRIGLPIQPVNRQYAIFGRDQNHLKDEILSPLRDLITTRAPWLRTPDWESIVEDQDDPSPEGLREISELRSKGAQKWEAYRLDLSNGVSFRTRTLKQSARSLHLFAADMDDPLTENNAGESSDIKALIQGAVLPAIEPGGIFLLLGTPQHPGDLLDLCKDDPDWQYSAYPSYDLDHSLGYAARNAAHLGPRFDTLSPEDRHCLWPDRDNFASLEASRGSTRESEQKYLREKLLQRITDDSALVHYDHIVAARDPNLSYHHGAAPGHHYRGGVDPSKLKKDEAGFCVGYVTKDGTRIPASFSFLEVNPSLPLGVPEMKVVEELNSLSTIFGCYDWMVESNGFQSAIAPLTHFVNGSIRFTDFHLGANKHTENGWAGLRTAFRSRKVRLPYATPQDRALTDRFVHQLRGLQYVNGEVIEDSKRKNDLVSAFFLFLKNTESPEVQYSLTAITAPASSAGASSLALSGQSHRNPLSPLPSGEFAARDRIRQSPSPTLQSTWSRIQRWRRH